jgi:hypothetical protein
VVAVGAIVATGLHFVGGRRGGGMGVPVIRADDKPIKTRPDDRGGMQVPNQDKLVYERMDSAGDSEPKVERLLPQPETAKAPPKTISVPPLSAEPPAQPMRPAPIPAKPGEPPAPKTAPQSRVTAQPALPPAEAPAEEAPPAKAAAIPLQPQIQAPAQPKAAAQPEHMAPAVVAQAPRAPAPVHPAPATAKAPPSGEYVAQLGAVRAADQAEREWARIAKANADLLGGLKPDIMRVDLPGKGTFWRVRAAPLSEQAARQLCAELASRSQGCIVARR